MNLTTMRYEKADRIAVATFATPDNLNGITEARLDDLEAIIADVRADDGIGALIITGEGRAFCVGLDLDLLERAFGDLDYFDAIVARMNRIITALEALPIPTITANNGFTRAGGFELSLGCDFMFVADEAKVGDVHTDAGVLPACVTLRLKRRVGDQRAKEILWTARWYKGQEAVDIGLARRSVPLAELLDEAKAFARTLVDKPRPVIATLKKIMRDGEGLGTAEGAAMELAAFSRYNRTEPYGQEGYRAFREKRSPSWKAA